MRSGVLLRTAIASVLLALVVGAAFAILVGAIGDLRESGRQVTHSRQSNAAADGLEKLVLDLETGARGFVITREERFLRPWNAARAAVPGQTRRLADLVQAPDQASRVRTLDREIESYIQQYSVPLVNAVRQGKAAARSVATTEEGKRRVDALRAEFDRFRAVERARLSERQRSADRNAARAATAAMVGLAASVVLILFFGGYLTRVIAVPLRRAAAMAGRLAGGDLAVRVPETGMGEVGELERAFNRMGGSLEASRGELRRLADEQAALRRVATLVAHAVPRSELFGAVAEEVGRLLGADLAVMLRYETDDTVTAVATWAAVGAAAEVGARWPLEGGDLGVTISRTGRPARVDDYDGVPGRIAAFLRDQLGVNSSVGGPIVVEGRLWGALIVHSTQTRPLSRDSESRVASFAELVATAIANADGRAELVASRARLLTAGDDARRHVVRDLHDGAQQRLVHTIITLKLARRAQQKDDESADALFAEALDQAEQANAELRDLAHGILPPVLARGGLRAGVSALVSRLHVPVDVAVDTDRLPPEIEASAYFVVAESLTNVVKHSRAHRAEVKAWVEDSVLHLDIRDDGVGGARPDGPGLLGLNDRLLALGGRLRVDSPPDGGTRVTATLPL